MTTEKPDGTHYAIVACVRGKRKDEGLLPAEYRYKSSYWTVERNFAEAVFDKWFILSAKYGILHPVDRIPYYDVTRGDRPRERVVEQVAGGLVGEEGAYAPLDADYLTVVGGQWYVDIVTDAMHSLDVEKKPELRCPLQEIGCPGNGVQMQVMNKLRENDLPFLTQQSSDVPEDFDGLVG